MGSTFYDILGVSEDADGAEIKKSYRGLSLRHHPDRGGESAKFQQISEAYETLSDPVKRRAYDMERKGSMMFGGGEDDGLQNIFQNLFHMGAGGGQGIHIFHQGSGSGFGTSFGQSHPFFAQFVKQQTVHVHVEIELEQVFTGCVVPVHYERFVIREDGSGPRRAAEKRVIELTVPQGIQDGETMLLPDVGNVMHGIAGDLKVTVDVVPHAVFKREGLNLHYTQEILLRDALCGFQFDVPLLNRKKITIKNVNPPVKIVYPEMQQVCPGYGFKQGASVGALIIHFKILFPDALTDEARAQLYAVLSSVPIAGSL